MNAGEPAKYMGCGDCENLSHTTTVPVATDDVEVLHRLTKQLFGSFHLDAKDIRGVGLQVSKLESFETSKQGVERSLKSWLLSSSPSRDEQCNTKNVAKQKDSRDWDGLPGSSGQLCNRAVAPSVQRSSDQFSGEGCSNQISGLPPVCNLDIGVIESLPPEVLSELNEIYGGKLVDLIARGKGKVESPNGGLQEAVDGPKSGATRPYASDRQAAVISGANSNNVAVSSLGLEEAGLMPSSLSQVDKSVLRELPEELRSDIMELLPAHRRQDLNDGTSTENQNEAIANETDNNLLRSNKNIWTGNPPEWVNNFKSSNFLMLNTLAEMYYKSRSAGTFSSILQRIVAESSYHLDTQSEDWSDAVDSFCELIKQYIKLKLETDIEEVYVCFRLLKRLTTKSDFFLQVYDVVLPCLQASVDESYGGSLHLPENECSAHRALGTELKFLV